MNTHPGKTPKRLLCAGLVAVLAAAALAAETAELKKTVFTPDDPRATILTVNERGYYSLRSQSKTGTAIEVVDRMAGVIGTLSGAPGERDGRIDLLLDPGEYRVNLFPDPAVKTPAQLEVLPFSEANPGAGLADLPFIYDDDFITTTLNDRETRSWWIYLSERTEVRIEAAGRTLTACALWQNGQWLMPIPVTTTVLEPEKGRPLYSAEIHSVLEAGHYLLVCVGGAPRVWAEENKQNPFYIRRGYRFLGANGTQRLKISPFGRDAYLVSGAANYFECARQVIQPTRLSVGSYSEGRSRYATSYSATITKESKEPWCSLSGGYGDKKWLVLEAAPGDELEVSYFRSGNSQRYIPSQRKSASYWVSVISSIPGRDLIDFTPIATYRDGRRTLLLKDEAVRINSRQPYVRKINLLGSSSVYVTIEEAGSYRIAEAVSEDKTGARAKYRFTFLEDQFLGKSTSTDYQTADKPFKLVKGPYILEIQPISLGILHFACYKDRSQRPNDLLKRTPPAPVHSVTWPEVSIPANTSVYFAHNNRPGVSVGVDIRQLPLSLSEPLSAWLAPGQQVDVPVKVDRESVLYLDGKSIALTLSGRALQSESVIGPGTQTLGLKNNGAALTCVTLYTRDRRTLERFPQPVLTDFTKTFTVFTADQPYFADFDRSQTQNVLLRVTEPALYRIETQGRLAMSLAVRTPLVPSLFSASENSVGRNALVESYLRPGDYLVSISARGRSRGRAGVALRKTPLSDQGLLPPDVLSRQTVPADIGLRYRLFVEKRGRYSIFTFGLGVQFPYRLEDEDGFPLTPPNRMGVTLDLDPGAYAFYSLPVSFVTRRLTRFSPFTPVRAATAEGKNNELPLNTRLQNVWKETPSRSPDVYRFTLPAALPVVLSLSSGMTGELKGGSGGFSEQIMGGKDLTLELKAGSYALAVKTREVQNLFPYSVGVSTSMLAAGLRYSLGSSRSEWLVSVAEDKVYDLWTFGMDDLKASLWDETGTRLLAENDDMESDWNFRITQRLAAGRYRLRIEPAGYASGSALLSMDVNEELALPERKPPFTVEKTLGREILQVPLRPAADGILIVKTESGRAVRFGLYRGETFLAEGEDLLAVPLGRDRSYSLHVFQRDDNPQAVKVAVSLASPPEVTLPAREFSVDCPSSLVLNNPAGLSYRFGDADNLLLYSPDLESPCLPVSGAYVGTGNGRGYLLTKTLAPVKNIRVEPLALAPDRSETVFLTGTPHSFLCRPGRDDLTLVTAETQTAAPGVSLTPRAAYRTDEFDFRGMDSSLSKTFLLLPAGGDFQGKVWSLETGRAADRANLLVRRYAATRAVLNKGESRTYTLPPGRGLRITLNGGAQSVRVLLARDCAASVWNKNRPEGMAVADLENRDVLFEPSGGVLALVNTGSREALAWVKSGDTAPTSVKTMSARGFETTFADQGRLVLRVPAGKNKTVLCIAGLGFEARLLSASGKIHRAAALEEEALVFILPAEAGDLEITHGRGFASVFFAPRGGELDAFTGRSSSFRKAPLTRETTLKGTAAIYPFSLTADGFVSIASTAPGLLALSRDGRVLEVSADPDAGERRIIRRLPKGSYEILSRPLAGTPQSGSLVLTKIASVDMGTADGAKKYFIGRGEVHVFRFRVTEAGTVGVGLAVEDDNLRSELYDDASKRLGEGALLFRPLEKGTYYLVVHGADRPVQYAPLLYGNEGSDAGVPKEIVDQYKQKEGEE